MIVYTNKPEKPKKLDLSKEDIAKLPKSAMFGNFDPTYVYKEVITRKGANGKPVGIESEREFKEPNLPLTRMTAFRHAAERAEAFHLMNRVAKQVPVNLGESAGFKPGDNFRCEIWALFGESEDDELLVWDSYDMLASLMGNMNESAVFELLLIPGANPAKPDYNLG